MSKFLTITAVSLVSWSVFAVSSQAQCVLPDNADGGPCCEDTQLQLPQFPAFRTESLDICWRECQIENVGECIMEWTRPMASDVPGNCPVCGLFAARVRIRDASGAVKWRGLARMTYSRTWVESSGNERYQVWRFLVNADLRPTSAAGAAPCPLPPCANTHKRVRHTGYVDYALNCDSNEFSHAWMLTHGCDRIDHQPGFPRGTSFHPGRSYTFVGPSAGFIPNPLLPIESGGGTFECVRRLTLPIPGVRSRSCQFEEQIDYQLSPVDQLCVCGPTGSPNQFTISDMFLGSACGSTLQTTGGPFLPGFMSAGIGMWTDPNTYPGQEILRWNSGGYRYTDPCTGIPQDEVFFGVTTMRGYQAFQVTNAGVGPQLPFTFVDQANSKRKSGNTIMNMPFFSDHILNLNF